MRHPKDGHPPIAVAEFLTQDHTVLAISHFLETIQHHEAMLFGSNNIIQPLKFVIDSSITLLTSLIKFTLERLSLTTTTDAIIS